MQKPGKGWTTSYVDLRKMVATEMGAVSQRLATVSRGLKDSLPDEEAPAATEATHKKPGGDHGH